MVKPSIDQISFPVNTTNYETTPGTITTTDTIITTQISIQIGTEISNTKTVVTQIITTTTKTVKTATIPIVFQTDQTIRTIRMVKTTKITDHKTAMATTIIIITIITVAWHTFSDQSHRQITKRADKCTFAPRETKNGKMYTAHHFTETFHFYSVPKKWSTQHSIQQNHRKTAENINIERIRNL